MRSAVLLSGVAVLALAFAAPVVAETVDREVIIVTAPGDQRLASELIGHATALDRDDILAQLEPSIGNVLINEPGVSSTFFGQGASRPVLRGLGAERVQVLTNGLGVIDASAASPDHQVSADGLDAQRIEILRGPAALAYGGQAVGGVVNVIDGLIAEEVAQGLSGEALAIWSEVSEGNELGARAELGFGNFVANLSLSARDHNDFEIPGMGESDRQRALEEAEEHDHDDDHDDHDHEEESEGTLENSFVEGQNIGFGLSYVGERGFFGASFRNQTAEYGLPGHAHHHHEDDDHDHDDAKALGKMFAAAHDDDHDEEEEESPFIDLEHTKLELRTAFEPGGNFKRIQGSLAFVEYEHTEFEAPGEAGTIFENEGVEGRAEADFATGFGELALGVQFAQTDFSAEGAEAFLTPTERDAFGAFLYNAQEWENGYGYELGLRVEQVDLDNVVQGARDFSLFGASLGVHRHIGENWFAGVQLSLSERAPNESELFADGPHLATRQFEIGDADLDKERGVNLEGTWRWQSENVTLGINGYVSQFENFITLLPRGDEEDELPVFVFNGLDADFIGAELYSEWRVANGPLGGDWTFEASMDGVFGELKGGLDVPLLPPVTGKLSAFGQWGGFGFGARTTIADSQDNPGAGYLPVDGYVLTDFRAEYGLDVGGSNALVFVDLKNAFDEEVRLSTSTLRDFAPLPGRGLRAGLRLRF